MPTRPSIYKGFNDRSSPSPIKAMPKYPYYQEGEEPPKDTKPKLACSGLREDLKQCLLDSDCVKKDGRTPKECLLLGEHPSVPDECQFLRYSFYECRRSILDMRTRFRGRKGY